MTLQPAHLMEQLCSTTNEVYNTTNLPTYYLQTIYEQILMYLRIYLCSSTDYIDVH